MKDSAGKFNLEAERFRNRIFAFFALFAVLLVSTGVLNYLLQKANSDLKSLLDLTTEEYVQWQKISEKYRFLLSKESPGIADHTAARVRGDLVDAALRVIEIQEQYQEIFSVDSKRELFWPSGVTLDLVALGKREFDVLYWIYDYFGSKSVLGSVESIVITRPLESAVLLRSSWRGRVIKINAELNWHIENIARTVKYVVASSYVGLIVIIAFLYAVGVRPALHRLRQFSSASQRKLEIHLTLANFLEDVARDCELQQNPLEKAQWVMDRNAERYSVLDEFQFTVCKEMSGSSLYGKGFVQIPISCGLVGNLSLQVVVPDKYRDCQKDVLPFLSALASHIGLMSEVHLRQTAEEQRDIYYNFTDIAVNGLPSPIAVFNCDGHPIIVNPAFRLLFGFDGQAGDFDFTIHDIEKMHERLVSGQEGEIPSPIFSGNVAIESTQYYKSGRSLSWTRLPINNLGLAFVGHDITAVKDHLELQEHNRRLEYLGRMSGSAAHDINNMLAIIMNTLELVSDQSQSEFQRRSLIESAVNTCGKAADINRQLVSFARRQNLAPVGVRPESLVSQVRLFLESECYRFIEFTCEVEASAVIFADPSYLASSIINVVKNSIEAMDNVGSIHMDVSVFSDQYVMITVADNGPGFTDEEIEQALQPFYTSKPAGAGLGLAAVYGFVKQSNGQLVLSNKSGAVISITLPRDKLGVRAEKLDVQQCSLNELEKARASILLVEDNEALRQVITSHLTLQNYSVTSLSTFEKGVGFLSGVDVVDLLVTDIMLTDGLGFDLVKLARDRFPALEVIYITGYGTESFTRELEASYGKVLEKPFSLKKLSDTISHSIAARYDQQGNWESGDEVCSGKSVPI